MPNSIYHEPTEGSNPVPIVKESYVKEALDCLKYYKDWFAALFLAPELMNNWREKNVTHKNDAYRIEQFIWKMLGLNCHILDSEDKDANFLMLPPIPNGIRYMQPHNILSHDQIYQPIDTSPALRRFALALTIGSEDAEQSGGLFYNNAQPMKCLLDARPDIVLGLLKLAESIQLKSMYEKWQNTDEQQQFSDYFANPQNITKDYFNEALQRLIKDRQLNSRPNRALSDYSAPNLDQLPSLGERGFLNQLADNDDGLFQAAPYDIEDDEEIGDDKKVYPSNFKIGF